MVSLLFVCSTTTLLPTMYCLFSGVFRLLLCMGKSIMLLRDESKSMRVPGPGQGAKTFFFEKNDWEKFAFFSVTIQWTIWIESIHNAWNKIWNLTWKSTLEVAKIEYNTVYSLSVCPREAPPRSHRFCHTDQHCAFSWRYNIYF